MAKTPSTLINLDINETRAVKSLKRVVGHFYQSSTKINQSLELAGKGLSVISGPARRAVTLFTAAATAAAVFGTAVGEVTTISEISREEISKISLDITRAYGGKPAANAKALYQTISAGITDAAQASDLLNVASQLSVAGVTDLTTAVDGLTNIVNAYSAEGLTAADVSDTMFVAIKDGKTSAEELATTLGQIAPLAASLGVPFSDLAAGLATITTKGVATSEAVTQLRGALVGIVKETPKALAAAKELGVDFSLENLRKKGLQQFLREVAIDSGATEKQLIKLFGRIEGVNAVLALTAEDGAKFNEVLGDMERRGGATGVAFRKMSEEISQQTKRFKGLKDAMLVTLGEMVTQSENAKRGLAGVNQVMEDLIDFLESSEGKVAVNDFFKVFVTGAQVTTGIMAVFFKTLGVLGSDASYALGVQMEKAIGTAERYMHGVRDGLSEAHIEFVRELSAENIKLIESGAAWGQREELYTKAVKAGGKEAYDLLSKLEDEYYDKINKRLTAPKDQPRGLPKPADLAAKVSFKLSETDGIFDQRTMDDNALALGARIKRSMAKPIDAAFRGASASLAKGQVKLSTGATKFFQGLRKELAPEMSALANGMVSSVASGISGMVEAIASGANVLQSIRGFFGGIITQLGMMLIQLGTAGVIAGTLGTIVPALAPITGGALGVAGGTAAILAGGAMVALGGAMGGGGGGGSAGAPSLPSARSGGDYEPAGGGSVRVGLPSRDDLFGGGSATAPITNNYYFNGPVGNARKLGSEIADLSDAGRRLDFGRRLPG